MGWEHMISVQVQSDQLAHASGGGSAPRVLPVAGSAASESQTGGAGFSRLVQKEAAHQGDPRRSNTPFGISNIASLFPLKGLKPQLGARRAVPAAVGDERRG